MIALFVAPSARRQGVATQLLRFVQAAAEAESVQTGAATPASKLSLGPVGPSCRFLCLDRISPISSHTLRCAAVNLRVEKDNATAQALYASVGFAADPSHLVMAYGRTPSGEAVGGA